MKKTMADSESSVAYHLKTSQRSLITLIHFQQTQQKWKTVFKFLHFPCFNLSLIVLITCEPLSQLDQFTILYSIKLKYLNIESIILVDWKSNTVLHPSCIVIFSVDSYNAMLFEISAIILSWSVRSYCRLKTRRNKKIITPKTIII